MQTRWLRLSAQPASASGGSGAGRRKAAAPRRGAAALQSCLPGLAVPDTAGEPAVYFAPHLVLLPSTGVGAVQAPQVSVSAPPPL